MDNARNRIVDADDGSPEPAGAEDLALRVDVGRHGSVTVEMVRSDIQEHADVEGRLDGQIELVGGEFEDEGPVAWHRREIEGGGPQIAADPNVAGAGRTQQMTDERRRRRLAVGAGDADVAGLRQRAPQELDIADHLDASIVGGNDDGVRERDTGARHQGGNAVLGASGAHLEALVPCRRARRRQIVPTEHAGTAGSERPRCGEAGAGEPEHGHRPVAIERDPDHRLTST